LIPLCEAVASRGLAKDRLLRSRSRRDYVNYDNLA